MGDGGRGLEPDVGRVHQDAEDAGYNPGHREYQVTPPHLQSCSTLQHAAFDNRHRGYTLLMHTVCPPSLVHMLLGHTIAFVKKLQNCRYLKITHYKERIQFTIA